MKKSLLILILTAASISLSAQTQMLTFEPMVGGTGYVAKEKNNTLGLTAGGDIAYTALWTLRSGVDIGIKTGLGAGYISSQMSSRIHDQYTRTDYLGNEMDYTITGKVSQNMQDVRIDIPIMFAMVAEGLTLNVGIKNVIPVAQMGRQDIDNLNIVAYYPKYDVPVSNELITGLATDDQLHRRSSESLARYALGVSLELGYVGNISGCHNLGVLAYVDYFPLYVGRTTTTTTTPLVDVASISNPEYPVPTVTIHDLGSTIAGLQSFSFGVKLVYGIDLSRTARASRGLHY